MSSSVDRVEVFSQIQRRRRWSVDQKLAILAEAGQPGMSISYVARRHGISPSLVFGWRRRMTEGGKEADRADDEVVARLKVAQEKTSLALTVITRRGYAVRRVAQTLGVSRSHLLAMQLCPVQMGAAPTSE